MYTILIVDDSRVMRRNIQKVVRSAGIGECEFVEACDGQEALSELEKISYKADVILCDLNMPNISGIEFLDSLAERGKLDSCPVIVLTGELSDKKGQEALEHGASCLIIKPFTADSVASALRKIL